MEKKKGREFLGFVEQNSREEQEFSRSWKGRMSLKKGAKMALKGAKNDPKNDPKRAQK